MDPSIVIWLEIAIFGGLFYVFMYFAAVKGPVANKVKEWTLKAREARRREVGEQDEKDY